jgi:hypothetical protein
VPANPRFRLSAEQMVEAVLLRSGTCSVLGLMKKVDSILGEQGAFTHSCGGTEYRFDDASKFQLLQHVLRCASSDRLIAYQHDMIRDALVDALRRAGLETRKEPSIGRNGRRADLSVKLEGKIILCDVVSIGEGAPSYVDRAWSTRGAAATRAQDTKRRYYAESRIGDNNYVTFAMENSGLIGEEGVLLLHCAAEQAFGDNAVARGRWLFSTLGNIAAAHMKGASAQARQVYTKVRRQANTKLRKERKADDPEEEDLGPLPRDNPLLHQGTHREIQRQRTLQQDAVRSDGWLAWDHPAEEEELPEEDGASAQGEADHSADTPESQGDADSQTSGVVVVAARLGAPEGRHRGDANEEGLHHQASVTDDQAGASRQRKEDARPDTTEHKKAHHARTMLEEEESAPASRERISAPALALGPTLHSGWSTRTGTRHVQPSAEGECTQFHVSSSGREDVDDTNSMPEKDDDSEVHPADQH